MDFDVFFIIFVMSRKKYQIEVGEKFYWSDRRLYHIINIFIDGFHSLVTMKTWSKYKKRWSYVTVEKDLVEWWFSSNSFKEVNK